MSNIKRSQIEEWGIMRIIRERNKKESDAFMCSDGFLLAVNNLNLFHDNVTKDDLYLYGETQKITRALTVCFNEMPFDIFDYSRFFRGYYFQGNGGNKRMYFTAFQYCCYLLMDAVKVIYVGYSGNPQRRLELASQGHKVLRTDRSNNHLCLVKYLGISYFKNDLLARQTEGKLISQFVPELNK